MKKFFRSIPFKYRIFSGSLLVAVLPLLLCSMVMVYTFTATMQRQNIEQGNLQSGELCTQFAAVLTDYQKASAKLAQSQMVQRALIDRSSDALDKDVYLELYQSTAGIRGSSGFALYDVGGQLRFSTDESQVVHDLPVRWGLLRKAIQADAFCLYAPEYGFAPNDVALYTAECIYAENGMRIGYIVGRLTVQNLESIFAGMYSEGSSVMVVNPQWRLVYSSRPDDDGSIANYLRTTMLQQERATDFLEGYRYFYATEPTSGYSVVLRQPVAISAGAIRTMQTISFVFAAVSLVLCIIISMLLSQSLVRPIGQINKAMETVRSGDLSIRLDLARQDELGQLANSFNEMTGELKSYMESQVQHQKNLNEAEIRKLQAQLNPHFLYNTLDTMKWLAKINHLPQVASLASNLAGILRQSIANRQFITLRQELDLVERYIDIQKIRFYEKFEYVIDVPESTFDYMIPKLILQPLVENAIIHGLNNCESGYIYIYGAQKDGKLQVSVTDDGCGMPPEMVDRLNSAEPKILEGHLGLYNVSSIIQLYYGKGYGLQASSKPGVGTTITVVLPAHKEDDEYA